MCSEQNSELFVPLRRAAARLGVPAAWLRAEALAGRIPSLQVGRRLLVNVGAIESVLLERAARAKVGAHDDE